MSLFEPTRIALRLPTSACLPGLRANSVKPGRCASNPGWPRRNAPAPYRKPAGSGDRESGSAGRFDRDPRSDMALGARLPLPTLRILAELFQEGSPEIQVLFADVRMSGMSGPELAQVARRLRPDLRIVLTSGIPFVPKPWRTGDLVDVVRRAASSELSGRERAA